MLAHKEVLGLDSARTNVVRLGVQLSSVWVHMVPLVLCKNLTFCCFSCICFCIRFWRQRITCILADRCYLSLLSSSRIYRTVTSPLCLFQLLGSEQKGVLFECNPTHLSLESGAFSIRLRRHNGIFCLGKARRRLTSVTLHAS